MKTKAFKILKRIMIITLIIVAVLAAAIFLYMRHPKFGKAPSGERLVRIQKSPNFKDGKFQNLSPTPDLAEGYSMMGVTYDYFFNSSPRRNPTNNIPSVKSDLLNLPPDSNVLVWFGHSSYFMQLDGKRILVDPVFSGNASPLPGTNKAFKGTDIYKVSDLPDIDYLFITHDHYDHLDHETILELKDKTQKVICGLGVGSHLEYWGYAPEKIIEKDWYEQAVADSSFAVYVEPARHFAGRGFSKNNTLWVSFVLHASSMKIYIGGDSGYDSHYAETGNKYGPFDLAILDNGQYDPAWKYIHNLPEEVLKASTELKAKRLFPVHSSKFIMGNHAWDDPLIRITELNKSHSIPLVTPVIGEIVNLDDTTQLFRQWWKEIK